MGAGGHLVDVPFRVMTATKCLRLNCVRKMAWSRVQV